MIRLSGGVEDDRLSGQGELPDGLRFRWKATFGKAHAEKKSKKSVAKVELAAPLVYPPGAFGRTKSPARPEYVVVKGATVWTCGPESKMENAAGGLTVANVLHGSANPIGGQNAVIKLRWGALPEDLKLAGAMPGIKFALGENVKQSNSRNPSTRYPQTRMGVEQIIRDRFKAARDYEKAWQTYNGMPLVETRDNMHTIDSLVRSYEENCWVEVGG